MRAACARRALVGTATVLIAGVAGCDGVVEGGSRLDVPIMLSLELARGPVTWVLDSLTVTVDAGDERQEETIPLEVGVDVYELVFDVPDGRIRIAASVTSTRGVELMTALHDGPADDVVDLVLQPVASILAVSAARPDVGPDEPGLFQIFNLGTGNLEWSVGEVTPDNACPVESFARTCLRFSPTGGVIPADGMDSVTVELVAGAVQTYGFGVESPQGAVSVEATVTAAARAGLEVRVTDASGAAAGGEAVEVAGPVTVREVTDDGGHALFTGLPLGSYAVTLVSTGDQKSVVLLENGAFESVAFTILRGRARPGPSASRSRTTTAPPTPTRRR